MLLVFWPVLRSTITVSLSRPDSAHALAIIVMIGILVVQRRRLFADVCGPGSPWGLVLIILAIAGHALLTWPFSFAYPRFLAVVPALAGAVLAVGGWRTLIHALPMLLLVLIAIPIGTRYWASLIIRPETITLDAVRISLDMLPGVTVDLTGLDLTYERGGSRGTIALGEPRRGATLLLAFLTVGVFVTFIRVRPLWKVAVAALAAAPLVLLANYARLLIHGVVTIVIGADPLSPLPRAVATVLSLLLAYGLFVGLLAILDALVIEPARGDAGTKPAEEPSA
ncbi:MAG: archaeosortase/exosortase family protein [Planctomycetota bacterium]